MFAKGEAALGYAPPAAAGAVFQDVALDVRGHHTEPKV